MKRPAAAPLVDSELDVLELLAFGIVAGHADNIRNAVWRCPPDVSPALFALEYLASAIAWLELVARRRLQAARRDLDLRPGTT